jgi:uncharacterized protein
MGKSPISMAMATRTWWFADTRSEVAVFLNTGSGRFGQPIVTALPETASKVVAGDFNKDGKKDLAVISTFRAYVLLGNGGGTFQSATSISSPDFLVSMAAGDFTGDGNLDLALLSESFLWVLAGNGDGTFRQLPSRSHSLIQPQDIVAGDFNGDGRLDVAISDQEIVGVFPGNGDGSSFARGDASVIGNSVFLRTRRGEPKRRWQARPGDPKPRRPHLPDQQDSLAKITVSRRLPCDTVSGCRRVFREVNCMPSSLPMRPSRRGFAGALATAAGASQLLGQQSPAQGTTPAPEDSSLPERRKLEPETVPFGETMEFHRRDVPAKVRPFSMTKVRLLPSAFKDAQDANLGYLRRLDSDRLLHNFRANAGLPAPAPPLGEWEKPDCELRGHFVGHYLSACALMYSATGDREIKAKGDAMVAELAKCQQKLGGGYLSAFPTEFFDRLNARQKVWAPFYTVHKIMAGMLDMSQHCQNKQALEVVKGMADWADHWTAPIREPHMQDILNTEYGGMNEILYNLAAVTGNDHYAVVGDRFTKKRFLNPLALHRDELRGLHVNTHIPQVIGAARRYELTGDHGSHEVADYFWHEVTSARAYVTGGTSNNEGWLVEPGRLGAELRRGSDTTECCCAYNMLKLTRQLYTWNADPRYFDYYERTLYNHRLAAIDRQTGATIYYLSIGPAGWKTFNTENDSFWCCTGTGVEEFSKLNDSIYFHDSEGVYVNLFIPSELNCAEKGLKLRQETSFPESPTTSLLITMDHPREMRLSVRIPRWTSSGAMVKINGQALEAVPSPGSYAVIKRTWKTGDRLDLEFPMSLRAESMPDEPTTRAFLYGPLVLAGDLGSAGLTKEMIVGPMGPKVSDHPMAVPGLRASGSDVSSWIKLGEGPLTFHTTGQEKDVTLVPLHRLFGKRYSVYWNVS